MIRKKLRSIYNAIYYKIMRKMVVHYFEVDDTLISVSFGTIYDTWDVSIKRNTYPEAEEITYEEFLRRVYDEVN